MKRILYLLIGSLATLLLIFIYLLYFSPSARKSNYVFENYQRVKPGMTRSQALKLLTEPDTIYSREDSTTVLSYYMGFGAPSDIQVLIAHDTVVFVDYAQ